MLNVLKGFCPKLKKFLPFFCLLPETCIVPGICQRCTHAGLKILLNLWEKNMKLIVMEEDKKSEGKKKKKFGGLDGNICLWLELDFEC